MKHVEKIETVWHLCVDYGAYHPFSESEYSTIEECTEAAQELLDEQGDEIEKVYYYSETRERVTYERTRTGATHTLK